MLHRTITLLVAALALAPSSGRSFAQDDCQLAMALNQRDAQPASEAKRAAVDPNKFAIVIAGAGGEPAYTKKFTAQAHEIFGALTEKLGFEAKNVYVLTEHLGGSPENQSPDAALPRAQRSTAEEARKAFDAIKTTAKADSLVLIFLIGHGASDAQQAKFNLVGPDLTAKDYAQMIGAFPTRRVVFINCSSSSGEFIKSLSAENRIVITATRSGNEQNATVFAEHFILGLTSSEADSDKNTRVSVLEAFDYATKMVADWYKKENRLATEHALIDDNGDGKGNETATAGDGALAKTTYFDSKTVAQAGADAELLRLMAERERLEQEVEKLKVRKADMKEEDYERQLEELLVKLATVNQTIKARQK